MTHLVNANHLIVALDRFFVALQRAVPNNTIALKIRDERHDCARAFFGLLELSDALNDRIFVGTDEFRRESEITCGMPRIALPNSQLLGCERCKVSQRHDCDPLKN
jgi:hypothetical protein